MIVHVHISLIPGALDRCYRAKCSNCKYLSMNYLTKQEAALAGIKHVKSKHPDWTRCTVILIDKNGEESGKSSTIHRSASRR